MVTKLFTIAHNTFIEVIRQPIYLIVLFIGLLLVLLSPYFTFFVMLANIKLVKDMGLATMLLTGLVLAALSAANVISREIDTKTALLVIAKPVSRATFILGKYLGILASILVAQYLLALIFLLTVRTEITEAAYSESDLPVLLGSILAMVLTALLAAFRNFFHDRPFASSAVGLALPIFSIICGVVCFFDNHWGLQPFAANIDPQLIMAVALIMLALSVLSAVAVAASTRLPTVLCLALCFAVFLLGLFSDYVFGRAAQTSQLARIVYCLVPNLQFYSIADAIMAERSIPWDYPWSVAQYSVCMVAGILLLAMALFQQRELD